MKILGWIIISLWVIYNIFMLKIFGLPLAIAQDPFMGSGMVLGTIGLLALGIWLVCRKRR